MRKFIISALFSISLRLNAEPFLDLEIERSLTDHPIAPTYVGRLKMGYIHDRGIPIRKDTRAYFRGYLDSTKTIGNRTDDTQHFIRFGITIQ